MILWNCQGQLIEDWVDNIARCSVRNRVVPNLTKIKKASRKTSLFYLGGIFYWLSILLRCLLKKLRYGLCCPKNTTKFSFARVSPVNTISGLSLSFTNKKISGDSKPLKLWVELSFITPLFRLKPFFFDALISWYFLEYFGCCATSREGKEHMVRSLWLSEVRRT